MKIPNKYGGWHINPSKIVFTDGEYDPWRVLSPTFTEPGSPNRTTTPNIPQCNAPPPNDTVFGMVYPKQVHWSDLSNLLDMPFAVGRNLFPNALEEWLPCFGNGTYRWPEQRSGSPDEVGIG